MYELPSHQEWVQGRITRKQLFSRPGHVWPEVWANFTKKAMQEAIDEWKILEPLLKRSREKRKIKLLNEEEWAERQKIVQIKSDELKKKHPVCYALPVRNKNGVSHKPAGNDSAEYFNIFSDDESDSSQIYIPRDSEESDWEGSSAIGEYTWTDDEDNDINKPASSGLQANIPNKLAVSGPPENGQARAYLVDKQSLTYLQDFRQ